MSKIVVLNSGGFDSVILAHEVKSNNPDVEIHNLFFNYGQLPLNSERKCSRKCADKLGFIFKEITLPQFNWSDSVLSGGEDESQYIPLRNVILLGYALSYAESIGADKVYCAFIHPEGEYYKDTSPLFLEKLNDLSKLFGIKVLAPFIHYTKGSLLKSLARVHGIYQKDIHSCNFGDNPCGECSDCLYLQEIFADMENKIPDDILIDNNFKITEDFVQSVKDSKITSAKLYINNSCQFSCKHCFLGKNKMLGEPLTEEEWIKTISDLHEYGITYIDFFGKEPLINDKVFTLMKKCKELNMSIGLITNGVNVEKYIDEITLYKPSVAISVESLEETTYRDSGFFITDTIKLLLDRNIRVSVSIDLTNENADNMTSLIRKLAEMGVKEFYIKPIRPFGESEDYLMDKIITPNDFYKCFEEIIQLKEELNIGITVSLAMMDLFRFHEADGETFNKYIGFAIQNRLDEVNGVTIDTELYCHRYMNSIAITPDGYVLGCASEYCTNYSHFPNIKEKNFYECASIGKNSLCTQSFNKIGCYFCKKYVTKKIKIW